MTGLRARDERGAAIEVRADLVVGADGRDSTVRSAAGLRPRGAEAATDVLWCRVPREPGERRALLETGTGTVIAIDRDDCYQLAHVIPAGTWTGDAAALRGMQERVARIAPGLGARVAALGLEDISLLRVRMDTPAAVVAAPGS